MAGELESLQAEIDELVELFDGDPKKVRNVRRAYRTTYLDQIKRRIIIGEVLFRYLLMDEHLSSIMCWYFFGTTRTFPQQWRSKRFRIFNYHVVEKLYLQQKVEFVRAAYGLPKAIVGNLVHCLLPSYIRSICHYWNGPMRFQIAYGLPLPSRQRGPMLSPANSAYGTSASNCLEQGFSSLSSIGIRLLDASWRRTHEP